MDRKGGLWVAPSLVQAGEESVDIVQYCRAERMEDIPPLPIRDFDAAGALLKIYPRSAPLLFAASVPLLRQYNL